DRNEPKRAGRTREGMGMTGRVADTSLAQNAILSLQASLSRVADLQNEASSGKKLTKPSDSPVDIGTSLQLHAALNRNTQLATNISDAAAWLGTTGSAIGQVVTQLQQVNSLVIQAANTGATDQTSRDAIANQIDEIRHSLIGLANTQYGNRPLFGGTTAGSAAYDASGNYVGTTAAVERTIAPGVQVQVNVTGEAVFGTPGNDIFTTLTQLSNAIHGGQPLTALSAQLNTQTQQVETVQATVGATASRVDTQKNQNTTNATTMQQNLSNVEDADMAQVLMNLQTQEATYQAALAAAAKAIQPSLAAFLQ
ncbi:MAG TPA: flagellar hook-associated protein FlgL, partial [Acidimicrobiia bacterium]|nr:flagellar hook-associated protein FlgL [Acidimicrobiia bacterium]